MSQQQRSSYLRQEGESCDAYSDRFLAWHCQSYPVYVGPCRYARATTPFRAEDVFTHIANCARPLTEDLAEWLEELSERYPYEWAKVLAQVRRKGGPSLNPAPIPRVEVVLKLGLGWSLWIKVQRIITQNTQFYLTKQNLLHTLFLQPTRQRVFVHTVGNVTNRSSLNINLLIIIVDTVSNVTNRSSRII
jgi:hypothetical protein